MKGLSPVAKSNGLWYEFAVPGGIVSMDFIVVNEGCVALRIAEGGYGNCWGKDFQHCAIKELPKFLRRFFKDREDGRGKGAPHGNQA